MATNRRNAAAGLSEIAAEQQHIHQLLQQPRWRRQGKRDEGRDRSCVNAYRGLIPQ
jgi:hypothetical protein